MSAAATAITAAGPARPAGRGALLPVAAAARLRADPRSSFLLLLAVNIVTMGRTTGALMWLAAGVVLVLLAVDVHMRAALTLAAIMAASALVLALPALWPSGLAAALGVIFYWTGRFAISLSAGAWFIATTPVGRLLAAMTAIHMPRILIIPMSVLFRFLPVAIDETRGVLEAMALRGYTRSYLWRHPLAAIEKLVVPVLAASARIADELSAAALIRGLGVSARPTVVTETRFRAIDAVLVATAAALIGLSIARSLLPWV